MPARVLSMRRLRLGLGLCGLGVLFHAVWGSCSMAHVPEGPWQRRGARVGATTRKPGSAVARKASGALVPPLKLRGGGEDKEGGLGLLAIDLGSQNTRAAMSALPGRRVPGLSEEGLAVLVQNDMSKLETPTAVAFRGSRCEVGELASEQPASNVHNKIYHYMPHLGVETLADHLIDPTFNPAREPPSGTASAVVEYKGDDMPVALELAAAFQAAAMAQYACAQVASQGGKESAPPAFTLALTVPTYFNARQIAALQDASAIAGFGKPVLVAAADALAHEYKARHKGDLASFINASACGKHHVALIDIGHSSASVTVVRYSLHGGGGGGGGGGDTPHDGDSDVVAKVIAAGAEVAAGAGSLDLALLKHCRAQVESKCGQGSCAGPKATSRLLKACERMKKMLSTIESTKVSVVGLVCPGAWIGLRVWLSLSIAHARPLPNHTHTHKHKHPQPRCPFPPPPFLSLTHACVRAHTGQRGWADAGSGCGLGDDERAVGKHG